MRTNNQGRSFTMLGSKIAVALIIIAALFLTFAGPDQHYAHAASSDTDPTAKSADSLPTNSPSPCLAWDGVRSQLNGAAPSEFVTIPNVGTVEIDDTVYANGCSKAFGSDLIMSGLVYVHWAEWANNVAMPIPPSMTVTLSSQVVVHGINATWSAGVGANAGANASAGSSANGSVGASANFNFSINPSDSTILNSTATISNQQSATFSYQNLQASAAAALGAQVTQTDAITITVNQNAQPVHYEKEVTSFT
jgi:hypothetical protein